MGSTFFENIDISIAKEEIRKKGCFLIPEVYTSLECEQFQGEIDALETTQGAQLNYGGSELRIYDAHKLNSKMNSFFEKCHRSAPLVWENKVVPQTLLAIRNKQIDPRDKTVEMGRWHIDSFNDQLKFFLFLTDTSEDSGPFEFIPKTHRKFFKYRMLLQGKYFSLKDFLGSKRVYQSLPEDFIANLATSGMPAEPVIVKKGTVMVVNTSAIHRARPCFKGERYALTSYYV